MNHVLKINETTAYAPKLYANQNFGVQNADNKLASWLEMQSLRLRQMDYGRDTFFFSEEVSKA